MAAWRQHTLRRRDLNSPSWQPLLFRIKHLMGVIQPAREPPVPQEWKSTLSSPLPHPHCVAVTSSTPDYAVGAKRPESTLRWSASCSNTAQSLGLPRQAWMSPGTHRSQTQVTLLKIWLNAGKVAKNCQTLNYAHIHFKKALPAYKQSPVHVGWKSTEWQLTGWLLQPAINCSFQVKMVPLILFAWLSSKLHIRRLPFLTKMSNNLPNSPIHTGFNSNFI